MDKVEQLIRKYVDDARIIQLATVRDGQPWCCTLHVATDKDLNLYWISAPSRRHSQELMDCGQVAAAIAVQSDVDKPVIGVQLEGDAHHVDDHDEIERIVTLYAERFGNGLSWIDDFLGGRTPHELYKLKPRRFVLFDQQTFPEDTRKEWRL